VLAQTVLQPALTDDMRDNPAAAQSGLGQLVPDRVLSATLVRVKLWSPEGTVLYSNEPQLVGRTFTLDDEARRALTVPQTDASVSDLDRPENQFERGEGKLLEVYRPVWTPAGHPLLFETYFRYDAVNDRSRGLWRGFVGIILSSLAALLLLLTPLVWSLLRRTRQAQRQREAMMRRAVAASDAERSRIAATVHDGVVQQLVASSFDIAGRAERAAAAGDGERAEDLRAAAATLRNSIGGLRSLLVEIQPANLADAGLAAALHDVASTLTGSDLQILIDVDADAAAALTPVATEAAFRVAQEAMRNAAKHANAAMLTVGLREQDGRIRLEIDDDGSGFDATKQTAAGPATAPDGHLGLQLIADAARTAGAELLLASRPGLGTHYRMAAPAS
jgi:two-component system NarL family sensor kinase